MNPFIASDKIVSVTHLQIWITLYTNTFIASNECVLCWGRTLLALEMNVFHAGNEHFSTGDERVENVRLSFSHNTHTHTHTHTHSYQWLPSRIYVEMIAIVIDTYLWNGRFQVEEIRKVSRCTTTCLVALNWSSKTKKNYSWTSAYSQLHAFGSLGVAWLYMPRPE